MSGANEFDLASSRPTTPRPYGTITVERDSTPPKNIYLRSRSRNRSDEPKPGLIRRLSRSRSRGRQSHARSRSGGAKLHKHSRSSSKYEQSIDLSYLQPPRPAQLDLDKLQGNVSTIGLAVGSPSQLRPVTADPAVQPSRTRMEDLRAQDMNVDIADKSKGTRWKKIGGLFKAKNALNDAAPKPFYQLQGQYSTEPRNSSEGSLLSHADPATQQDPRFLFDNILASNGHLDPQRYVSSPVQQFRDGRDQEPDSGQALGKNFPPHLFRQKTAPGGLSLLNVEIPDVQLERYSVMFGSLLDGTGQSRPVKKERSIGNLIAIADEVEVTSEPMVKPMVEPVEARQPQPKPPTNPARALNPRLEAPSPYPRRATSPTPQPSPSFSLFPRIQHTPGKVVGPICTEPQAPLQRSFTSPGRLSPMQETFDPMEITPVRSKEEKKQDKITGSSLETTSTSDPVFDSSNQSGLSPASTRSSIQEDILLDMNSLGSLKKRLDQAKNLGSLKKKIHSAKSLGSLKRKLDESEPMTDRELKVLPLRPRKSEEAVLAQSPEPRPETPSGPHTHEDTLAALERPKSPTSQARELAESLKPTKSRIDQIMQGSAPKKAADAPENSAENLSRPGTPQAQACSAQVMQGSVHNSTDELVTIGIEPLPQPPTPPRLRTASPKPKDSPRSVRTVTTPEPAAIALPPPAPFTHSARSSPVLRPLRGPPEKPLGGQNSFIPRNRHPSPAKRSPIAAPPIRAGRPPNVNAFIDQPQQGFAEHRAKARQQIAYARQRGALPANSRDYVPGMTSRPMFGTTTEITANFKPRDQSLRNVVKLPLPGHGGSRSNRSQPKPQPSRLPPSRPQIERTPSDKEADTILDLYLEDSSIKIPNKLQKRSGDSKRVHKKLPSPPDRHLPFPYPPLSVPERPSTAPKSPVPISKYSGDTTPISQPPSLPLANPPSLPVSPDTSMPSPIGPDKPSPYDDPPSSAPAPAPKSPYIHRQSQSHSSISLPLDRPLSAEERAQSPAVQAARRKAAMLTAENNANTTLSSTTSSSANSKHRHSLSHSISNSGIHPPLDSPAFTYTVHAPSDTLASTGDPSVSASASTPVPTYPLNISRARTVTPSSSPPSSRSVTPSPSHSPRLPPSPGPSVYSQAPNPQASNHTHSRTSSLSSLPDLPLRDVYSSVPHETPSTTTTTATATATPLIRPNPPPRSASAAAGSYAASSKPMGSDFRGFLRPSRGEKVSRVPGERGVVVQPVIDFGIAGRVGVVGGGGGGRGKGRALGGIGEGEAMGMGGGVGQSRGHRVDRSVNLVIESV